MAWPDPTDPSSAMALVLYRLSQIEAHMGKMTHPLEHAHLTRRVELLERQADDNRKLSRSAMVGVLLALVVPTLTYVGQLAQLLPTG